MRNLSHARGIDGINMSRGCPAVSDDSNVEFFQNIPVIERVDRWHNVCRRKSRMAEPRIIVFVKAPRPGFVKTRLAIVIGDEAACEAYRQLTEAVLAKLTSLPNVEIRFTPDDAKDEIKSWLRKCWGYPRIYWLNFRAASQPCTNVWKGGYRDCQPNPTVG